MEWQNEKVNVTEVEERSELTAGSSEVDLANDSVQVAATASLPQSKNPKSLILREGQTLRTIALDLFGNKEFWVYIYQENENTISNPNVINVGTTLIIPDITSYDINPDNPQSVAKAKGKGDSILDSL